MESILIQLVKEKYIAQNILRDIYYLEHKEKMESVFKQMNFVNKWRKRNIDYHQCQYPNRTEEFYCTDKDFIYRAFLIIENGKYTCHIKKQNKLKFKL